MYTRGETLIHMLFGKELGKISAAGLVELDVFILRHVGRGIATEIVKHTALAFRHRQGKKSWKLFFTLSVSTVPITIVVYDFSI